MSNRVWIIGTPDREKSREISKELSIGELVSDILAARGYDRSSAVSFLSCTGLPSDPYQLKDMDKAVKRIEEAVEAGERITVFGDYDCDGIAATVIVYSYLDAMGANVGYYIPHREDEGYGLNIPAIDRLSGDGTSLIITVDNGISAISEVEYAREQGIDVIITDHHQTRDTLPNAVAVVDPHRADCPSSFKALAGVGVAFKLVCALEGEAGETLLEQYGDILAMATVADVVELTGENRIFARAGLPQIEAGTRPGLMALLERAGIRSPNLTSEQIAYSIAPRINAVGRMESAEIAVRLLLCEDPDEAALLADQMENCNLERRRMEQIVTQDINACVADDPLAAAKRLLILCGEGWHGGIIGIVCSKLMDRLGKPVILITHSEGVAKGSGRSMEGFSLVNAVSACSEHLTRYGGHTMATGFSLQEENVEAFTEAMQCYATAHFRQMPMPTLKIDCAVKANQLTLDCAQSLSVLEPFGAGNETPVLVLLNARLEKIIPTVDQKHLRLKFAKDDKCFCGIYFCMNRERLPFFEGDFVDIAFHLSAGDYMGEKKMNIKIKDIRLAGFDQSSYVKGRMLYEAYLRKESGWSFPVPTREDIGEVYRFIRSHGTINPENELLYSHLPCDIEYFKVRIAVDILLEMGLLVNMGEGSLSINITAGRVDIQSSAILKELVHSYASR